MFPAARLRFFCGGHRGNAMKLEQAREILDTVLRSVRMTREEHGIAAQALGLLYDGAKENEESQAEPKVIKMDPIRVTPEA